MPDPKQDHAGPSGIPVPTYSLNIQISRNNLPGVELRIHLTDVNRQHLEADNPAFASIFRAFDRQVAAFEAQGGAN